MIFETKDVNLYYEISGSGQPLIMLHGNGEDHTIFDKALPLLAERFTVYRIDTRGHGQSSKVKEFHYDEMADDIYQFIAGMNLEKPVVYGFSDGGILSLLLAIRHPDLLSKIIVSGVNTNPQGIQSRVLVLMKLANLIVRSPKIKLMLTEPDITDEMLASIRVPVFMTAGSKDLVKLSHVQHIGNMIPDCTTNIFLKESHGSYISHSKKIAEYILDVFSK